MKKDLKVLNAIIENKEEKTFIRVSEEKTKETLVVYYNGDIENEEEKTMVKNLVNDFYIEKVEKDFNEINIYISDFSNFRDGKKLLSLIENTMYIENLFIVLNKYFNNILSDSELGYIELFNASNLMDYASNFLLNRLPLCASKILEIVNDKETKYNDIFYISEDNQNEDYDSDNANLIKIEKWTKKQVAKYIKDRFNQNKDYIY